MTNKQKQNLLAYLGYYVGDIDGIWGALSKTAMAAFTKDFSGLNVPSIPADNPEKALKYAVAHDLLKPQKPPDSHTGDFWDECPNFTREEFRCTCGGRGCNGFPAEPRERLVRNAQAARDHFGKTAPVSSGVRCKLRNSELPGSAANSLHLTGRAMDFCIRGVSSAELLAYVRKLPEVHEAYAIDGSYVHMGVEKYGGGEENG